jgi:hypothetical protein
MKNISAVIAILLSFFSSATFAQDALSSVTRESTSTKPVFAVFDVRPAATDQAAIQEAVAAAFRERFDKVKINQGMAPYPLPAAPGRMIFNQVATRWGTISSPTCPGSTSTIIATDSSMMQYGEMSVIQACVFPYHDGIRVNFYSVFIQATGGADTNILGAMLGRMFTKAVGLGDSSKFIDMTVDSIEQRLQAIAPATALVDLQPAREGKKIAADPAGKTIETANIAAPSGASGASATFTLQTMDALAARKELTAMGLTYHNQDQFIAAIRRNDKIACELFLKSGAVDINTPDRMGSTAMMASKNAEITEMLKRYASAKL